MSEPLCDNTALPVASRRTPRLVRGVVLFLVLVVLAPSLRSQQIIAEPQVVQTSIQPKPHNPTKALLLSLVPGAGQIYNGQAWKIPIIYAALGGVGYFVYDYYTNMTAFKNEYLHRVNGGTPQLKGYTNYPNSSIYNLYQSNNKNFQLFVIISAAVYGLTLSMPTSSGISTTSRSTTTSPSTSRPPSPPTSPTPQASPPPCR